MKNQRGVEEGKGKGEAGGGKMEGGGVQVKKEAPKINSNGVYPICIGIFSIEF